VSFGQFSVGRNSEPRMNDALRLQRRRRWKQNVPLLIMFAPILAYYVLFKYVPMGGLVIAFKNYNFRDGILHSPWVGMKYFEMLWNTPDFLRILRNTVMISVTGFIVGFPFPIALAILLNEVRKMWYKRIVQTLLYLPHFLSMVIITGILITVFASGGTLNILLHQVFGVKEAIPFLYRPVLWLALYFGSGVWQEAGFGAIIYLAALSNIDPSLYESAALDGASKWRQIWHITLPGIRPTIVLLMILHAGRLIDVGFDKIYMLSNPTVSDVTDVISTYVYRVGLQGAQFSYTTAIGLFESLAGLILILTANRIARRYDNALF